MFKRAFAGGQGRSVSADLLRFNRSPAVDHPSGNVDTETFRNKEQLRELRIEHRDLDEVIRRLQQDPLADELQLRRLKKRKLRLKDLIAQIESAMIPDLDA